MMVDPEIHVFVGTPPELKDYSMVCSKKKVTSIV